MDKEKKVRSSRNKFAWSPQQEQILKTWGEASACYRYMHNHAFLIYKKQNMHFSLPVIILSTVTGTANFAQSSLPASIRGAAPSMIGGLNLIAGIIATVMQFLKISEMMEGNRVASLQYGKLSRTIRLELTLPLEERSCDGSTMIDTCRAEYDKLIEQSPPIPYFVIQAFEKQFPDDSGIFKPEIMHIQPIDMFISEDEMGNELKKDLNAIRNESGGSELSGVVIKS
jgi:hypothetical protein